MNKSFFLLVFFVAIEAMCQTQIVNPGLELWYLENSKVNQFEPVGWISGSFCNNPGTAQERCNYWGGRTTDAHSGKYGYAIFNTNSTGGASFIPGAYGGDSITDFTGRPSTATFWYKYATDEMATGKITFLLYNQPSPTEFIISGKATFNILQPVSKYTLGEAKFIYEPTTVVANKMMIFFDFDGTQKTGFDTLKLDDFSFNYPLAAQQSIEETEFEISINKSAINFSKPFTSFALINSLGIITASGNGDTTEVPISHLPGGVYFLHGSSNGNRITKRLVIPYL